MDNNYIYHRVRAEVDLGIVLKNITNIKNTLPDDVLVCIMLNADGFGHGAVPIAKKLKNHIDMIAVATAREASNLIDHNITVPVLILERIDENDVKAAVNNHLRMTICDTHSVEMISRATEGLDDPALVHIKICINDDQTGFKLGDDTIRDIITVSKMPNIHIEGMYLELPHTCMDMTEKETICSEIDCFDRLCGRLEENNINITIKQIYAHDLTMHFPYKNVNMIRFDGIIYGLCSPDIASLYDIRPAMSLYSHIVMIKTVPAGTKIGYGGTYETKRESVIATVSVGYADGYMRNMSNKGHVLVKGYKAPITGRICMDQLMIDITDIPNVQNGDEVILLGNADPQSITAYDMAAIADSCANEIVCNIGKRVPRIYVEDGEVVGVKEYFYDRYTMPDIRKKINS